MVSSLLHCFNVLLYTNYMAVIFYSITKSWLVCAQTNRTRQQSGKLACRTTSRVIHIKLTICKRMNLIDPFWCSASTKSMWFKLVGRCSILWKFKGLQFYRSIERSRVNNLNWKHAWTYKQCFNLYEGCMDDDTYMYEVNRTFHLHYIHEVDVVQETFQCEFPCKRVESLKRRSSRPN